MYNQMYYTGSYGVPYAPHMYGQGGVDAFWFLLPVLAILGPLFILIILWSIFWKGLALWHSARRGEQWWFVALMVVHTLGILEIIYLFFFAKLKMKELFSKHEHHN